MVPHCHSVVAQIFLVVVKVVKLEMRIKLEAAMRVELDDACKGECSFELFVCTVSMYGIVDPIFYGGKKPIHFFFVCGWFSGVIMSHHTANSFEFVDMTGHICAIGVADSFNESLERFFSLF